MGAGQIHCQRGWPRYGNNPRHARPERLGDDLVGDPTTDHQHVIGEWIFLTEEGTPDHFIYRIMAPYILAYHLQTTTRGNDGRGVQRAREFKHFLFFTHGGDPLMRLLRCELPALTLQRHPRLGVASITSALQMPQELEVR